MTRSTSEAGGPTGERQVTEYDELPYPSLPVSYCHPSSLSALVQLFGIKAPVPRNARFLEMGCASGGNLIPLAFQYPDASFLGLDLSEVQVRAANARIRELGLKNVKVMQADLLTASYPPDSFDFILCHGVFSWVGKPVQDSILRICSTSLSRDGVAIISFNVLPGWHLRRVVRDISLLHAGARGTQQEKADRARRALVQIAGNLGGKDVYTSLLQSEARRLQKMPSAYISGEFLAENNLPCLFTEFYARSKRAGLDYVCDAEFAASLPEQMAPASAKMIHEMAGGNAGAAQQYIDLFTGRPFRRAVLVRDGRLAGDMNVIDPERLRGLHFAAELSASKKDGDRRRQSDPDASRILRHLASVSPSTVSFGDLLALAPSTGPALGPLLLDLMNGGHVAAFAEPIGVGKADVSHPVAWPVARLDARAEQPWLTSQHHRAIRKIPVLAWLLPLMDGSRTHAQLQSALEEAVQQGKLSLPKAAANGTSQKPASVANAYAAAMEYAARNGLLGS